MWQASTGAVGRLGSTQLRRMLASVSKGSRRSARSPGPTLYDRGAPEIKPVRDLARACTGEALVDVMRNGKTDAAQGSAAIALLEPAWARPQQPIERSWGRQPRYGG
jgi:hypothetical protein